MHRRTDRLRHAAASPFLAVLMVLTLAGTACADITQPADPPAEDTGNTDNGEDPTEPGDDERDDADGGATEGDDATGDDNDSDDAGGGTEGGDAGGDDNDSGDGDAAGGGAPAGNPDGDATVPAEAQAADTSEPDQVIGDGTAASCTSDAVVDAVAQGGVITFDCGPEPVTITMEATAKVVNDTGPQIVLDGGGDVTLSGAGERRILYMNTCDEAQTWTTDHCDNQDHPRLTVQNLTFVEGNSTGDDAEGGGGGAILVRGGRFKVANSRFFRNECDPTGPDVGGAAVRVLSQFDGEPVYVVDSTFGGSEDRGNTCSNGGALSSIGVSWEVLNSVLSHNNAIGNGANPARAGTPGGGSGAAIYNDGNEFTLRVAGSVIEDNHANEGGGAIFFVSNDRTGTLRIEDSVLRRNPSDGFETDGFPGIFYLGSSEAPEVVGSTIE